VFSLAFIIAELFYKFHSFALETAAFLVTWYLLDVIAQQFFPASPSMGKAQDLGNTSGV
jgi:hypothetical protein